MAKQPYTGAYPQVKKYLEKGDKGENVKRLQNYLNWYTDGAFFKKCGKADGIFGNNTLKYVKAMQAAFFGAKEVDGKVGPKTIAKMKAYSDSFKPKPAPTPAPTPTPSGKAYPGPYPTVRVTRDNAHVIGNAINFAKWIASNNNFHYGAGTHAHHNGCYFCNTQPASKKNSGIKQWQTTYCCNPFVHACWAHGGLVPTAISMCQQGRSWDFNKGTGYDASKLFKRVNRSEAKPGDVFCGDGHVALYIGNGKIIHAGHEDDNVPNSSSWNDSISVGTWVDKYYDPPRVYRFIGSVDADIIMRKGEVSGRVKDLQNYLIWYGALPQGEVADGYYGEKTFKAVVKMQTDFFGAKEADGTVGNKTIEKMKAYRK